MPRHQFSGGLRELGPWPGFCAGDQTQVAFGDMQAVLARHPAKHRQPGRRGDGAGNALAMAFAAGAVHEKTGQRNPGVEELKPLGERGCAAGHFGGINHQQHRRVQQLGDLGGAARFALVAQPIK